QHCQNESTCWCSRRRQRESKALRHGLTRITRIFKEPAICSWQLADSFLHLTDYEDKKSVHPRRRRGSLCGSVAGFHTRDSCAPETLDGAGETDREEDCPG